MIKAVIFDMFETLVTLFEGKTYCGEDIAADLGADPVLFRKAWHATEHDRSTGKYTIEEGLTIALKEIGFYSEENVALAAGKRREALSYTFAAIPEASIRLLQELHNRGVAVGLITNTFSDERDMIRACPLFPLFDEALISYEQGICKPDPELYQRMLQNLKVKAEECVYVGDGGSRELFAARKIGMTAVQCTWFRDRAFEPHIPCPIYEEFPQAGSREEILNYL